MFACHQNTTHTPKACGHPRRDNGAAGTGDGCSGNQPLRGGRWREALLHGGFVAIAVFTLIELVAVTVPFVPFARPYEPGHAKLKTRWPLYAIGVFLFGYVLLRLENASRSDAASFAILLLCLAVLAAAFDLVGQVRARRQPIEPPEELADDEGRIAVLDIGAVAHHAQIGG